MRTEDIARADAIVQRRHDLVDAAQRLAHAGGGSRTSRIHGDFHLGQVLVVSGDAYIIDFEGEPLRSLEERRAKSSPTRDVAGLLSSLDQVAAAVIDQRNVGPATVSDARRNEFIARFLTNCRRAFLSAYEAVKGAPVDRALLDLFLIQKAAGALTYEAANRPAWLGVPLAGLAALARRVVDEEHGQ